MTIIFTQGRSMCEFALGQAFIELGGELTWKSACLINPKKKFCKFPRIEALNETVALPCLIKRKWRRVTRKRCQGGICDWKLFKEFKLTQIDFKKSILGRGNENIYNIPFDAETANSTSYQVTNKNIWFAIHMNLKNVCKYI